MWPVKCSTKRLSKPLKAIFAAVKTGLQIYHHPSFSGIGGNQIWILKISKDSLDPLRSRSQCVCSNMKIFDFSTLYTTIPHTQLKYRIKELIQRCFLKKNGEQMYDYLVASWKATQSLIIHISRTRSFKCLIFLSTTYLSCLVNECFNRRLVFHWMLIVLHYLPIGFKGFSRKDRKLSQTFNSSYRYIDDVLSLNNSRFGDYLQFTKSAKS